MSGHSKWHSIKHKKGAADAKRGKIFTRHAKLIYIAAREGGIDPEMNATLRTAIVNAKADNVPNANIDKAIAKAKGGAKGEDSMEEIMYEGFGPAGTAFYIQVITDNKNRSITDLKTAFTKNGLSLGSAGSVAWMFEKKGVILATFKNGSCEDAELKAIDAGCTDISALDDVFEIITDPTSLMSVRDRLEKSGFSIEKAELSFLPKDPVKIEGEEEAKKILKFMETLEDLDDVSNVYANFDIPEEILEKF